MIIGEALGIPLVGFICQPDHKIEEDAGREVHRLANLQSFWKERRDTSTAVDQLLEPTRKARTLPVLMLSCVCVCVCVWSVCFECFGKSKAMNSEGFNAALMSVMQNLGLLCVASRFLQPRKAGAKADVGAGTEFELLAADTGAGSVSKCVNMHFVLKNQDLMSSNNVFCQFLPCLAEITIPAGLTDSSWAH